MKMPQTIVLFALFALVGPAWAGGSHYTVKPGALEPFAGRVSEWAVPTPEFARDPAPGPDGRIYIAVMRGNKIARFDPRTEAFVEWDLPSGAQPHGLLVDARGDVWYTGNGNGTIGRLQMSTGRVIEHQVPGGGDPHTLVITDDQTVIWFTLQRAGRIGRLDVRTGVVRTFEARGRRPYGITLDRLGHVWYCLLGSDALGRLDPASGEVALLNLPKGSAPRRMATAPDGSIWVTLYGAGKVARVDPAAQRITSEHALPGGEKSGPYAVSVNGSGIVYANAFHTDAIVRLDPKTGAMRTIAPLAPGAGIRKLIVDGQGRLWYMGSHNGRLGMAR